MEPLTTAGELTLLAACVCAGGVIGVVYDLFSLPRLLFRHPAADGVCDALFYGVVFCVAALTLLLFNDGRVRLHTLCAIALGAYLYLRFPSRLLRRILRRGAKDSRFRR